MRTTIDLPDELYRQIKARAALRGQKLKEYVTEALRASLFEHHGAREVKEPQTEYEADVTVISEDCVFPLIRGAGTDEMRSLTQKRINEILDEEDAERALRSGGR